MIDLFPGVIADANEIELPASVVDPDAKLRQAIEDARAELLQLRRNPLCSEGHADRLLAEDINEVFTRLAARLGVELRGEQ